MKRKIILPILLLFTTFNAFGQRSETKRERIKAQKVAFITERLDLSPEEAQKFWPIYNAYEDEIHVMRKNDLKEVRQVMREGNLSNDEAQQVLNKFMAVEDRMYEAKKGLVKDLRDVIPPQKIIALKVAEDAFNKKLFELFKEKRGDKDRYKD